MTATTTTTSTNNSSLPYRMQPCLRVDVGEHDKKNRAGEDEERQKKLSAFTHFRIIRILTWQSGLHGQLTVLEGRRLRLSN